MIESIVPKQTPSCRSSIRRSSQADLEAIRSWLAEEERQGVHGNFLCNWSWIERAHRDGELLVYIDGKTSLPLAYQLGGLVTPGILQVRNICRGSGIGRKMVERCIARATKRDQYLLYIQCKPSTSIPFWEHMGFTLIEDAGENSYAYRVIDKPLQLPSEGEAIAVVIRFFPESSKWDSQARPYVAYSPEARLAPDGIVHLAQRVQFHECAFSDVRDVVVEIEIGGVCRFRDKAKYEAARQVGVSRCVNGFYIDAVHPL